MNHDSPFTRPINNTEKKIAGIKRRIRQFRAFRKGERKVASKQEREMSHHAISPRGSSADPCLAAEPLLNYIKYLTRARPYPGRRTKRIITSPSQEIQEGWRREGRSADVTALTRFLPNRLPENEGRDLSPKTCNRRRRWRLPERERERIEQFVLREFVIYQPLYVIYQRARRREKEFRRGEV